MQQHGVSHNSLILSPQILLMKALCNTQSDYSHKEYLAIKNELMFEWYVKTITQRIKNGLFTNEVHSKIISTAFSDLYILMTSSNDKSSSPHNYLAIGESKALVELFTTLFEVPTELSSKSEYEEFSKRVQMLDEFGCEFLMGLSETYSTHINSVLLKDHIMKILSKWLTCIKAISDI